MLTFFATHYRLLGPKGSSEAPILRSKFLLISLFSLFAFTACGASGNGASNNGVATGGENSAELRKQLDSLRKDVEDIKLVLKHAARMDVDEVAPMVREQVAAENKSHEIPVADSPVSGQASAKMTIVEFTDLQCPYCTKQAEQVRKIQETFPNDVRVVFKHFPLDFHKEAPAAHAAAIAAQKQGKFWEYRYAVAPHFRDLSPEMLLQTAQEVGLDMEKFKKDMVLDAAKRAIYKRDMELGTKVGVRGTPTFFVNGKLTKNFSFDTVSKLLQK